MLNHFSTVIQNLEENSEGKEKLCPKTCLSFLQSVQNTSCRLAKNTVLQSTAEKKKIIVCVCVKEGKQSLDII